MRLGRNRARRDREQRGEPTGAQGHDRQRAVHLRLEAVRQRQRGAQQPAPGAVRQPSRHGGVRMRTWLPLAPLIVPLLAAAGMPVGLEFADELALPASPADHRPRRAGHAARTSVRRRSARAASASPRDASQARVRTRTCTPGITGRSPAQARRARGPHIGPPAERSRGERVPARRQSGSGSHTNLHSRHHREVTGPGAVKALGGSNDPVGAPGRRSRPIGPPGGWVAERCRSGRTPHRALKGLSSPREAVRQEGALPLRAARLRPAAGGADAAGLPRGVPRPGAPPRPGQGPGRADPPRRGLLDDLLGPAGQREDHARLPHRALHGTRVRPVQRRDRGRAARARDHRRSRGAARAVRSAHHPLLRRDPPLQPRAAGRLPPARRARDHRPDRRDHREPELRDHRRAACRARGCSCSSR